jgi:hypothetical protein
MWPVSRRVRWSVLALLALVAGSGSGFWMLGWLHAPASDAFAPIEMVTMRFPEGWEREPVRPLEALRATGRPQPSAPPEGPVQSLTRMSADEFAGALAGLDAYRASLKPAQPANAVFNDAQIASLKQRLGLTPDQERHWPGMEEALRRLAWRTPNGRNGPALEPASAQRLKEVADELVPLLNERQKRDIRLLANIGGLKLGI